tara:strand:+ start:1786 stop:2241 length:456 start_codon:yes stop_codon:yes gene_type:complete
MSTQSLILSHPSKDIRINNIAIDKFSRPAKLYNQQTSPETTIDVFGDHTVIIQTQPLITPNNEATQFKISNLGETARTNWPTGAAVKINILAYAGFDGLPFISGYKDSTSGDYVVDVGNVVKTGSPPAAYPLNGHIQFSVELTHLNVEGIP